MRILVIGATGVVGRQLVPMLVDEGHEVTATTTTASKAGGLAAAGADPLVMDVLDAAATEAALIAARPEVVVYQATALSAVDANMRKFDRYFAMTNRLRTEGTANLMAAVQEDRWRPGGRAELRRLPVPARRPAGAGRERRVQPERPPAAMASTFAAIRRLEELVTAAAGQRRAPVRRVLRSRVPRWTGTARRSRRSAVGSCRSSATAGASPPTCTSRTPRRRPWRRSTPGRGSTTSSTTSRPPSATGCRSSPTSSGRSRRGISPSGWPGSSQGSRPCT